MIQPSDIDTGESTYRGLRMSADEYLALPEEQGYRYELVNGVVCMSPSASFGYQRIIAKIAFYLGDFLELNPIGHVAVEVDVKLRDDLVLRPDLIFLTLDKAARCKTHVTEVPDLVIELVSQDSRSMDTQTRRADYEAAGVREYWIIDPIRKTFTFLVLRDGRYQEVLPVSNRFQSTVLPGFELDLDAVRRLF